MQMPPNKVYVHPVPNATRIGFITDTIPAPIKQRTMLNYQQHKIFEGVHSVRGRDVEMYIHKR